MVSNHKHTNLTRIIEQRDNDGSQSGIVVLYPNRRFTGSKLLNLFHAQRCLKHLELIFQNSLVRDWPQKELSADFDYSRGESRILGHILLQVLFELYK